MANDDQPKTSGNKTVNVTTTNQSGGTAIGEQTITAGSETAPQQKSSKLAQWIGIVIAALMLIVAVVSLIGGA